MVEFLLPCLSEAQIHHFWIVTVRVKICCQYPVKSYDVWQKTGHFIIAFYLQTTRVMLYNYENWRVSWWNPWWNPPISPAVSLIQGRAPSAAGESGAPCCGAAGAVICSWKRGENHQEIAEEGGTMRNIWPNMTKSWLGTRNMMNMGPFPRINL